MKKALRFPNLSKFFFSSIRNLTQQTLNLQPLKPSVITSSVPGPKGISQIKKQQQYNQCARTIIFHMDAKKSIGNYICDPDGNVLLDIFNHIAAVPIGYNHLALINAIESGKFKQATSMRYAMATNPPMQTPQLLKETYLRIAPPYLTQVLPTCGCGTSANENALKLAHLWHYQNKTGKTDYSLQQLQRAQRNENDDESSPIILSFMKGFHGRIGSVLSATHTDPKFKAGFPSFPFLFTDFPEYEYPLHQFIEQNKKKDEKCLQAVEDIFRSDRQDKNRISALIIEPLPSEGGNIDLSKEYFQSIRKLCTQYKVAMIVDQVQTGVGGSGKWWFFQHLLTDSTKPELMPDMITIAKKGQASAILHKPEFRPPQDFQVFGTWSGDYLRLLQFEVIIDTIINDGLLQSTTQVGEYFKKELENIALRTRKIEKVRGKAALLGFDVAQGIDKGQFVKNVRLSGLNMGASGKNCVRVRQSLIFQKKHADIALDIIETTLKKLNKTQKID